MVTKTLFILIILLVPLQAHRQHVHQRLVIEAYNLLKIWFGNSEIPIMINWSDNNESIYSTPIEFNEPYFSALNQYR
jgi:hypothetical protein